MHMSLTTTEKNLTSQVLGTVPLPQDPVRLEALEFIQNNGFPTTKHEEYRHTPISRELEKNFNFSGDADAGQKTASANFLIPGFEANILVFINGKFSEENSRRISPPSEFTVTDLATAVNTNAVAKEHFARYANHRNDAFTAWNTAAWSEGVFIHVPDNAVVTRPIIIHHIHQTDAEAIAVNRNLIVSGKNSQVTILEKFDSAGSGKYFLNLVTEVMVDENAEFNFYSIHNDSGNRYQYGLTEICQKRSSRVNTYSFTLNGKLIRNNLHLVMDGEGIESHMYGLYLIGDQTLADNHTVADHRKPNSYSNEMYKGIMEGNSRGVFNGKIFVRPQAQKTNAFQANRNILLTDKASVNTKPQLEIWADDVKCSHGCTSGQLDEEALFYLRTRGINKETAQAMMLYAFAGEIIDRIKDPQIKEFLDAVISERLHKNF